MSKGIKPAVAGALLSALIALQVGAQGNFFFPLHNIIRGDTVYDTFDKQVAFIKKAGYDGIEINQVDSFNGMKAALDKHRFPGAFFYVKVKLEEPYFEPLLEESIRRLKGSKTIISPYIVSESRRYKPSSGEADELAVRLIRQVADWAGQSGLEVAIYPHVFYYVERAGHALDLAQKADRKNVGLTFNLCHWLATTDAAQRATLREDLKQMLPYLKMMTICGANDVVSEQKNIWDDYILPLGTGSFDTYELVKYVLKDLKFKGPVGVQCYNIKGDKQGLVLNTMTTWKTYKTRLRGEK